MIEKWKKVPDKKGFGGNLSTNLPKDVDCLKHDLLIAKLAAYGFDSQTLKFAFSYPFGGSHRTKINNADNNYLEIIFDVPKVQYKGLCCSKFHICGMFLGEYECEIASYADDTYFYVHKADFNIVISKLQDCTIKLFKRFKENNLKANCKKCHLLVKTDKPMSINIESNIITSSQKENLLGIRLDSTFLFENHATNLFKKAS